MPVFSSEESFRVHILLLAVVGVQMISPCWDGRVTLLVINQSSARTNLAFPQISLTWLLMMLRLLPPVKILAQAHALNVAYLSP